MGLRVEEEGVKEGSGRGGGGVKSLFISATKYDAIEREGEREKERERV